MIQLDPKEVERQVRDLKEPLAIKIAGTEFVFEMEPRDLRSHRYRAEATGDDGLRVQLPLSPAVNTFKGTAVGAAHIQGRFTIAEDSFDGVVFTAGDWRYIEPVQNYLPDSEPAEMVVYKHSDIIHDQPLRCGASSIHHRLKQGVSQIEGQAAIDNTTHYAVEVATEADYEYVRALGGAQEANSEILSTMNKVEGVYEEELRLKLEIVYQHAWTTRNDPYRGTGKDDLLDEFTDHWNAHFFHEDYDLAHLWTAREDIDSGGQAWIGTMCRNRSSSYGWSKRLFREAAFNITAHEIGHNFGADHPDEETPPITSCEATIMQGSWEPWPELTFCRFSRREIRGHVSQFNSCLAEGAPPPPVSTLLAPSNLTAESISPTAIQIGWQDNSENESGFVIERRKGGLFSIWGVIAGIGASRDGVH